MRIHVEKLAVVLFLISMLPIAGCNNSAAPGGGGGGVAPSAATVTPENFHKLKRGMTLAECEAMLGKSSKSSSQERTDPTGGAKHLLESYTWRVEGEKPIIVNAEFDDGKLSGKMQWNLVPQEQMTSEYDKSY